MQELAVQAVLTKDKDALFQAIALEPEEKKTINFTISPEDLAFYDINMDSVVEPGIFGVITGSSSEDIRLKGVLKLNEGLV